LESPQNQAFHIDVVTEKANVDENFLIFSIFVERIADIRQSAYRERQADYMAYITLHFISIYAVLPSQSL
jgi:hypothetical protein